MYSYTVLLMIPSTSLLQGCGISVTFGFVGSGGGLHHPWRVYFTYEFQVQLM